MDSDDKWILWIVGLCIGGGAVAGLTTSFALHVENEDKFKQIEVCVAQDDMEWINGDCTRN